MIFRDNAPKYWAKNIPVIPLHKWDALNADGKSVGKAPCPYGWQRFNDSMPTAEEMATWLTKYPENNIGLPLGKQSGCIALDIDTCSEQEIALIENLVPKSPWVRVGQKGKVMMFRYNGEQTFRIKDDTGRTICELLSSKTQVVLPPSIHPTTKQPYVSNCELLDVIDSLPTLPPDLETILRSSFEENLKIKLNESGWTRTVDYVSSGSRDVKMTSVAGIYAQAVLRGEITLKEAIDMLIAWCSTQVENVAGDPVDVNKGVRNLVKFLMNDVLGPKKKVLPRGWDLGLTEEEKKSLNINESEDIVAWNYEKVRSYLREQLESLEDSVKRTQSIEYAVERIARSNMSVIEEEQCLKYIALTNKEISVPALRKRLCELRSNGLIGDNHTEIAKAVLKDINDRIPDYESYDTTREFNSLRYTQDKFWKWGGSHWEILERNEILKVISSEYGFLPAAKKSNDHVGILNVMKTLLHTSLSDLDVKGVNFANGFVDINGDIHKHSKKYGCTYTLPYPYNKEKSSLDDCPKFKKLLYSFWGSDSDCAEKIQALREAFAVTIFGYGPSFARAILLYGIAGSGKSQVLNVISRLLPPEVISCVPPYAFETRFDVVSLASSYLNICGELDETKPIPGAIFKQVIDGSEMEASYKFGQNFKFHPKATHWFASNHLPKSKDTTEGFNRRWLILEFKNIVKEEDKVRDIGNIIVAEERESIAAWAIEAMFSLQNKGDFTLPQSHVNIVSEMVAENNSVFFYLISEEGPRLNKSSSIPLDNLYESYRSFCYGVAGARPVGRRKFMSTLKEQGILYGFSVTNSEVNGLTMDKDTGVSVVRVKK